MVLLHYRPHLEHHTHNPNAGVQHLAQQLLETYEREVESLMLSLLEMEEHLESTR